MGTLHELRPDRERRARSFDPDVGVVINPHPHDAEWAYGVPGEPAAVIRSYLPGCRQPQRAADAPEPIDLEISRGYHP
jgi:hypothetical protein